MPEIAGHGKSRQTSGLATKGCWVFLTMTGD